MWQDALKPPWCECYNTQLPALGPFFITVINHFLCSQQPLLQVPTSCDEPTILCDSTGFVRVPAKKPSSYFSKCLFKKCHGNIWHYSTTSVSPGFVPTSTTLQVSSPRVAGHIHSLLQSRLVVASGSQLLFLESSPQAWVSTPYFVLHANTTIPSPHCSSCCKSTSPRIPIDCLQYESKLTRTNYTLHGWVPHPFQTQCCLFFLSTHLIKYLAAHCRDLQPSFTAPSSWPQRSPCASTSSLALTVKLFSAPAPPV